MKKSSIFKKGRKRMELRSCRDCKYYAHNPWKTDAPKPSPPGWKFHLCFAAPRIKLNSITGEAFRLYVSAIIRNKRMDCLWYEHSPVVVAPLETEKKKPWWKRGLF